MANPDVTPRHLIGVKHPTALLEPPNGFTDILMMIDLNTNPLFHFHHLKPF
jgi:hypothetical protein